MSLWDDVKRNLGEWYNVTSVKTTEIARISSRRYDKFGISREIERQFSELGNLVYTGLKEGREGILEDPVALDLVERIVALESELRAKDEEIENIRRETAERQQQEGAAESGDDENATDPDDTAAAGADEDGDFATATVLSDPVLDAGNDDSAILVEPTEPSEKTPKTETPEEERREDT